MRHAFGDVAALTGVGSLQATIAAACRYAVAHRFDDAVAVTALAEDIAADLGLPGLATNARWVRASVLAMAGRHDDALSILQALASPDSMTASVSRPVPTSVPFPVFAEESRARAFAVAFAQARSMSAVARGLEALQLLDGVNPALGAYVDDTVVPFQVRVASMRDGLLTRSRVLLALYRPMEALQTLDAVDGLSAPDLANAVEAGSSAVPATPPESELGSDSNPAYQAALLRAAAWLSLERPMQAVAPLTRVLAVRPENAPALVLYGQALAGLGEYAFAVDRFEAALQAAPRFAPAYRYMASALVQQGLDDAALVCLRTAREMQPESPEVWLDEAGIRLRRGELRRGFAAYEWRDTARVAARLDEKFWHGDDDLRQRSLLIRAEQGLGDAIQFLRYVPLVRAIAREVVVEVPRPLWRLVAARAAQWDVHVVPRGEPLPDCDRFTLLMSLPFAFRTTLTTIPGAAPYFDAAAARRLAPLGALQAPLAIGRTRQPAKLAPPPARDSQRPAAPASAHVPALRIGLVPSGNPEYRNDALRSMPLATMAPLMALRDVDPYLLVPEPRAADALWLQGQTEAPAGLAHGLHRPVLDGDLADTAALIETLDIVVTVDTAVAHLAGALGKRVWILLPFVADWRWLTQREDSPWYPSARLFRQPALRDWDAVVQEVANALKEAVAHRRSPDGPADDGGSPVS